MKNGIKDRDELRTLPIEKQQELQKMAAEDISNMEDDVILIDTHAFISTKLMSPFSTENNCGSSSRLKRRRKTPMGERNALGFVIK